jgi:hypothetical protein
MACGACPQRSKVAHDATDRLLAHAAGRPRGAHGLRLRQGVARGNPGLPGRRGVGRAFPSWKRCILTEIYLLCHACSYHEVEGGIAARGRGVDMPDTARLGVISRSMVGTEAYMAPEVGGRPSPLSLPEIYLRV